jgi:hypothetical protein
MAARELKTNTAVIVTVGPFLSITDGVTLKTSLTITNEKITLIAETDDGSAPTLILDNITGATSGTSNDLNYIADNDAAMMQIELSAANVNRLGRMRLIITDAANHVPVWEDFEVVSAQYYDAKYGTGSFSANLVAILGAAITGTAAQIVAAFTALFNVTSPVLTCASVNQTGDAYAKVDTEIGTLQTDVTAIKAKTDMQPTVWYSA